MTAFKLLTITFSWLIFSATASFGQFGFGDKLAQKTTVKLLSDHDQISAGSSFIVATEISHSASWHSYYKNPGGSNLPLEFDWQLPAGFTHEPVEWPVPHTTVLFGETSYTYENTNYFLTKITAPAELAGEQSQIDLKLGWQVCNDSACDMPQSGEFSITLKHGAKAELNNDNAATIETARNELPIQPAEWQKSLQISASQSDSHFTITLAGADLSALESLYYYDDKKLTVASAEQVWDAAAGTLTIERNVDAGPASQLEGILASKGKILAGYNEHGLLVNLPLAGAEDQPATNDTAATTASADQPAGNSAHGSGQIASEADRAAAAKLYDVNAKVPYVLLSGEEEKELTILTAVIFMFIGGFLLNLMPCVFPVLGLKVMGFVQQAGEDATKIRLHGLVFMTGLVASMWILAGTIFGLIHFYGQDINWGEQLTQPPFLAGMIILLFLFGLSMAGVFEIGTSLTSAGGQLQMKKGYSGSFYSGVLTTLIATPCSGPFLGSALAFTLKEPPLTGMFLFTIFALGISLPYVALAFMPKLIQKLPRPGAWMETFKQLMAFALFATAAYFYLSFINITGTDGAFWLIMALVILSLAAWAFGRYGTPVTKKSKKYVWGIGFPVIVASAGLLMAKDATSYRAPTTASEHSWYPGVVELSRSKGRIVWLDYTADW